MRPDGDWVSMGKDGNSQDHAAMAGTFYVAGSSKEFTRSYGMLSVGVQFLYMYA